MPQLVETNVCQDSQRHEKDKSRIEQNQASLTDMCVVEEKKTGGRDASWKRVSGFPHDQEHSWDGKGAHAGGHGSVRNIGDAVGDVGVANVLEQEVSFVSN